MNPAPVIPIVDYADVLRRMTERGCRCNYPNGGSFSFEPSAKVHHHAWIGPADPTIRPEFARLARSFEPPYEANLSAALVRIWSDEIAGPIWLMPASHWHFELNFGSKDWLPALLEKTGVDPDELVHRTNAAALEFSPGDALLVSPLIEGLLANLLASDFAIVFRDSPVLCALHHHKQIWWTTTDENLAARIGA